MNVRHPLTSFEQIFFQVRETKNSVVFSSIIAPIPSETCFYLNFKSESHLPKKISFTLMKTLSNDEK